MKIDSEPFVFKSTAFKKREIVLELILTIPKKDVFDNPDV